MGDLPRTARTFTTPCCNLTITAEVLVPAGSDDVRIKEIVMCGECGDVYIRETTMAVTVTKVVPQAVHLEVVS